MGAEKEEYEAKQKELEGVVNPILQNLGAACLEACQVVCLEACQAECQVECQAECLTWAAWARLLPMMVLRSRRSIKRMQKRINQPYEEVCEGSAKSKCKEQDLVPSLNLMTSGSFPLLNASCSEPVPGAGCNPSPFFRESPLKKKKPLSSLV